MRGLIPTTPQKIVTLLLLAAIALFASIPKNEAVPLARPLKDVHAQFGDWRMVKETQIESEVLDVLKADDTLSRTYVRGPQESAHLLVVFFKSQSSGVAPHSPKNCLPGSGWVPSRNAIEMLDIPGREPISVNSYVVAKGPAKSVVMYWYQSPHHVAASEYWAKLYTIAESVRYRRSDTSMVRVTVSVRDEGVEAAEAQARDFIRAFFVPLREYLPR